MSFVMKSFWAMAHGLHSMLEETCGRGYNGVCKEMYPFNGTLFKVIKIQAFNFKMLFFLLLNRTTTKIGTKPV